MAAAPAVGWTTKTSVGKCNSIDASSSSSSNDSMHMHTVVAKHVNHLHIASRQ